MRIVIAAFSVTFLIFAIVGALGSDGRGWIYYEGIPREAVYELPNGNELLLPKGLKRVSGLSWFGAWWELGYGESKLYFDATTWEPLIDSTVIGAESDKPTLAMILEQLKKAIPEYAGGYDEVLEAYFE